MSSTKLLNCKETSVSFFVLQASFCENFPFESALNGGLRSPLGAQPSPAMESGLWLLHFLLEHFLPRRHAFFSSKCDNLGYFYYFCQLKTSEGTEAYATVP